ncbi:sensory neuron membrane protein 2 isoform X4 [Drosophila guanche]|uniref:sensory neuron membrane protein 2 isoform X4 n=1 Tax=Drosophila guanche TaxID=7266 RepID=UPI0014716789|nr:sensory neuron membrane protein 2 isoform X4 [Drosophila guanche]
MVSVSQHGPQKGGAECHFSRWLGTIQTLCDSAAASELQGLHIQCDKSRHDTTRCHTHSRGNRTLRLQTVPAQEGEALLTRWLQDHLRAECPFRLRCGCLSAVHTGRSHCGPQYAHESPFSWVHGILISIIEDVKSVLQISENDPGLALLLVHLNANLKAVFNDPRSMFVHTSAREYLFDGVRFCINPQGIAKAICNQIKESGSKTIREQSDGSLAFSFFGHKNGSGHDVYEVHTGKGDVMKVLEIQKLDDTHNLQVWLNASTEGETSVCNQINGTDASAYPPFRQRGDSMYIFSADICRSVQLFYQTEIQYEGIPGYRYSIGENFINDIGPEHDNECFCVDKLANVIKRKNGCLYAGALDLTTCLDAPVILTLPHMLGASNEYRKMIRGLKPDAKKHQTFVDVQSLTGTPLRGGKRVQFNMFLKSINRIGITENLTTVLMPAIWVEEGIQLNGEMVAFFKKKLINTLKTLNIVHWAALCGGAGVALISLLYFLYQKGRGVEAPLK